MPRIQKTTEIRDILSEQLRLAKTEKQIQGLIDKINSQLNELSIEELQLKSTKIENQPFVTEIDIKPTSAEIIATYDSSMVNQQVLDASLLNCTNNQTEEDDEE